MSSTTNTERSEWVAAVAGSHGDALIRLAYVLSGDADEAQDIVQSVLVKLLATEGLENVALPGAYSRRAVTNEFLDRKRRLARLGRLRVRLGREDAMEESGENRVADRDAIRQALSRLGSRERTAVVLRHFEHWDDDAIAEAIGCAPATVRSLVSRALPRLRRALEQEGITS